MYVIVRKVKRILSERHALCILIFLPMTDVTLHSSDWTEDCVARAFLSTRV